MWVEWVTRGREEHAPGGVCVKTFGVSEHQAHRRHVCIVNYFFHRVASVFLHARDPQTREAMCQEVVVARIVSFL